MYLVLQFSIDSFEITLESSSGVPHSARAQLVSLNSQLTLLSKRISSYNFETICLDIYLMYFLHNIYKASFNRRVISL